MKTSTLAGESKSQRGRRMVAEMSNTRTLIWVGVALLLHAAVILGTSTSYIHEHWFGAKATDAKTDETANITPTPVANKGEPAAKPPAATNNPAPAQATAGLSDDDKKLAERRNTPEVKSITETAKPSEIPAAPKHNAFDIDDTPK